MEQRCAGIVDIGTKALDDLHLQEALEAIDRRLRLMRDQAFRDLEDAEGLRERARLIRAKALARLDEHLLRLEENITRSGGTVHWAETDSRAREVVEDLAVSRGVKTVVKGKSMVTEEIGLNDGLAARGVEVLETDLGEYIIQLAGEPPSHLVGPAIHKTRARIAELFRDRLGAPLMDRPEDLTMFARTLLRERFLSADMGITGGNFAVAEDGTLVLLENEGNIRLSTTLPRIHVAVMGIEKVVPALNDLDVLLQLLPRSASGQKLSSYVSFLTGPGLEHEPDGPDEFHLVLVDNGRTGILADPELRETLHCVRCGACLNSCPVYLKIGGHAYGWVYSGPIGAILTPQLLSDPRPASLLPFASTLCGACAEVCPVKTDIPRILNVLRRRFAQDPTWGPAPLTRRGAARAAAAIMGNSALYSAATSAWRLIPAVSSRGVGPFPPAARRTFRSQWRGGRHGRKE